MLSSSWLLSVLPHAVAVCLAAAVVFSSFPFTLASKQSALSRNPLSLVYSDLPYRNPLPVVLLSYVVHWLLFLYFPLPAAFRPPAAPSTATSVPTSPASPNCVVQRNYCVSTVHAVTAVCSVLLWLAVYEVEWWSVQRGMGGGRRGTGDEWQSIAVSWSLGYFVYDGVCMLVHRSTWSAGGMLHHCVIGPAFLLGLHTDCCRPFHFLFLLEELSTPPLNVKSLLRHSGGRLADWSGALFAASFLCVRLGYGTSVYVLACMQLRPFVSEAVMDEERVQAAAALFQLVVCTVSRLLNLYWAALIAQKVGRAIGGAGGSRSQRMKREVALGGGTAVTHTAGGGDKLD